MYVVHIQSFESIFIYTFVTNRDLFEIFTSFVFTEKFNDFASALSNWVTHN